MATAPDIEIRGIDESEYEGWFIDHDVAFGRRATAEDAARARPAVEVDRALAAFDGEAIVGTTHALSVELTVPGGACPTALVDMVGVVPTHRRRGVLTRMMERQLSDVHERGEPLAALTASESVIYGRFGYGIVSMHEEWLIDKEHSTLATRIEPKGRIRFVDGEEAKAPVLDVYLGVTSQRPGMVRYRPGSYETFLSGGGHGQAGGAVFRVVYEEEGRPLGYAKYRTGDDMLEVQELMGLTPAAWAALWGVLSRHGPDDGHHGVEAAGGRPAAVDAGEPGAAAAQRHGPDVAAHRGCGAGAGASAVRRGRPAGDGGTGRVLPLERQRVRAGGWRGPCLVPADELGAGPGAVGGRPGSGIPGGCWVYDAGASWARGRADGGGAVSGGRDVPHGAGAVGAV